jgi:hypothetical protein
MTDRLNSEHQFHSFFPYFISPYYHAAAAGSATPPFVSYHLLLFFFDRLKKFSFGKLLFEHVFDDRKQVSDR